MNNTRKANRKANLASGAAAGAPAAANTRNVNRRNNTSVPLLKIPDEFDYSEGIHIISARPIHTRTNRGNNYRNPDTMRVTGVEYNDPRNYLTNILTNKNKAALEAAFPLRQDPAFLRWITQAPQVEILKPYCMTPGLQLYYQRTIKKILNRNHFFEIAVNKDKLITGVAILEHTFYNIHDRGKFIRYARNIEIIEICTAVKRGGLGRQMVQRCIEFARAFGCDTVKVDAVPSAMDFYIKLGFIDEHKEYMEKMNPALIPYPVCKITRDGMIVEDFLKTYKGVYTTYKDAKRRKAITTQIKKDMVDACKILYERLYGKINRNNNNNGSNNYEPISDDDILRMCIDKLQSYRGEPSNCGMFYRLR